MASNTCETLIWERGGGQSPITEKGVHLLIKKEKPAKETEDSQRNRRKVRKGWYLRPREERVSGPGDQPSLSRLC